jgi:hypothetical protein
MCRDLVEHFNCRGQGIDVHLIYEPACRVALGMDFKNC